MAGRAVVAVVAVLAIAWLGVMERDARLQARGQAAAEARMPRARERTSAQRGCSTRTRRPTSAAHSCFRARGRAGGGARRCSRA